MPDKQVGANPVQHATDKLLNPEQVGKQPEELEEEEELDEEVEDEVGRMHFAILSSPVM